MLSFINLFFFKIFFYVLSSNILFFRGWASLFFLEVIMLWFDLLIIGIQTFFLVFFYLGLSQLHIHGCRVCDLTWFYCFFFFQLCPLILNCFIIQVNLNWVFFIFFDVIFFLLSLNLIITSFKLLIKSLFRVSNFFSLDFF